MTAGYFIRGDSQANPHQIISRSKKWLQDASLCSKLVQRVSSETNRGHVAESGRPLYYTHFRCGAVSKGGAFKYCRSGMPVQTNLMTKVILENLHQSSIDARLNGFAEKLQGSPGVMQVFRKYLYNFNAEILFFSLICTLVSSPEDRTMLYSARIRHQIFYAHPLRIINSSFVHGRTHRMSFDCGFFLFLISACFIYSLRIF